MIHISTNTTFNLLAISYVGHVTSNDEREINQQIEMALRKLRPGFQVLTDLSGLHSMDYACASEITKRMDRFRITGVGKVVRVVPDASKDIGFNLMSQFHYGRNVPVVTCESAAQAIVHLGG